MFNKVTTQADNYTETLGTLEKGLTVERWVENQLKSRGAKVIRKNYRTPVGELDLIIEHKKELAFVEVRYRQNSRYGDGADSVSRIKQRKIIRSAQFFLHRNPIFYHYPCRFDVISVTGNLEQKKMTWIQAAFEVE